MNEQTKHNVKLAAVELFFCYPKRRLFIQAPL